MSIVIDASVAVKWVLNEPGTDDALALRDGQLIAPELWLAEAANALWRRVRIGELTPEQALARIHELRETPVASLAIEPHVERLILKFATSLFSSPRRRPGSTLPWIPACAGMTGVGWALM